MVISSDFRISQHRDGGHQEDAPNFNNEYTILYFQRDTIKDIDLIVNTTSLQRSLPGSVTSSSAIKFHIYSPNSCIQKLQKEKTSNWVSPTDILTKVNIGKLTTWCHYEIFSFTRRGRAVLENGRPSDLWC